MTEEEFNQATARLFASITTLTLATVGSDGRPWATDVYFATLGDDFVFFSSPSSRHCLNLDINPACAATIHPTVGNWSDIHGVQIEGVVREPKTREERTKALARYIQKFPFAERLLSQSSESKKGFSSVTLYILQTNRILYLDNHLLPNNRFEVLCTKGKRLSTPTPFKNPPRLASSNA